MTTKIFHTNEGVGIDAIDPHSGDQIRWRFHVRGAWGGKRGYVYQGDRQVCYGLAAHGNTVMSSDEGLIDVIRREWAVYRRSAAA